MKKVWKDFCVCIYMYMYEGICERGRVGQEAEHVYDGNEWA